MRTLTGKFYIKERFFGGYDVMVEVDISTNLHTDDGKSISNIRYQKATEEDIARLCINKNTP